MAHWEISLGLAMAYNKIVHKEGLTYYSLLGRISGNISSLLDRGIWISDFSRTGSARISGKFICELYLTVFLYLEI